MQQQPLFFENVLDAIKHVIQCIGKPKDVGPLIFPHKENPADAGRLLSDCINENRDARLNPEQLILLLRLAKERGHHAAMNHICHAAGYASPSPVDPQDEKAELQKLFIKSVQELAVLSNRIKSTNGGGL